MTISSKDSKETQKNKFINRRKFFVSVGNSVIGVVGAGTVGVLYKFLSPNVILELPARFQIGSPDSFQPNSVFYDEEHRLFVLRNEQGHFCALSAVCTHLGCTTNWRPVGVPGHPEGVISCPCHGSVYSKDGNVISGPAPRPLDRFRIQMKEDKLFVDTSDIVSEDEMFLKIE